MLEHLTIDDLVERVLAELKRLAYAQNTQHAYRRFYNRVLHYALSLSLDERNG